MHGFIDSVSSMTLSKIGFFLALISGIWSNYDASFSALYEVAFALSFAIRIWSTYYAQRPERNHQQSPARRTPGLFLSRICGNCQRFFLEPPGPSDTPGYKYKLHSDKISILRQNAELGCPFCALVNRQLGDSIPSDVSIGFSISNDKLSGGWRLHVKFSCSKVREFVDLTLIPCDDVVRFAMGSDSGHEAIDLTNDSFKSRQWARRWHLSCKSGHSQCQAQESPKKWRWRPTRLLAFTDLQEEGRSILRLVDGSTLPAKTEYVALSHCWGKINLIKLLTTTEAELRSGIPITKLPKTFQQAITVSRWLNYNYLWIDSLCIIQDSAEDWQSESQTMKYVYSNGAITIVAAYARDATEGLFVERDPLSLVPPVVPCEWKFPSADQTYCVVDNRLAMRDVDYSNLARRAWTVQERALSPRMLTFARSQMFYECLEARTCESWPRATQVPYQMDTFMEQIRSKKSSEIIWPTIVSTYSESSLTKEEDKVIAFAGIAEAMQERLGDEYVVGLWKETLPVGLLWHVAMARKPRPNPCIAPTWSWLSTNGEVEPLRSESIRKTLVTIVNISVDLVDPAYPTGNIQPGALLQLRGRLKPARWNLKTEYGFCDFRKYQTTFDGLPVGSRSLDLDFFTHVDFQPSLWLVTLKIFFLPIATFMEDGVRYGVMGLVLTPKDIEAEIYERVGRFKFRFRGDGRYASYLFLEKRSDRDQEPHEQFSVESVLDLDGPVEDFPFEGGTEQIKIKEKDIVVM